MFSYIAVLCVAWCAWKLRRASARPQSRIDNLPGPTSPSWLFGHLPQLYAKQGWDFHRSLLQYGPVFKLQGMLGRPVICVYDAAAMYHIAVKDPNTFEEVQWHLSMTADLSGPGVLSATGHSHRKQRKLLNPVFSVKNLQDLTPVFYEVTHQLTAGLRALVVSGGAEIDMSDYMRRATLELIGRAAIGHSFDALTEARSHPFPEALKDLVPSLYALSSYFQIYGFLRPLIPASLRRPLMDILPSRRVKRLLRNIDTMEANAVRIYAEKKREAEALAARVGGVMANRAKDLMTILLHANAGASPEDALPEAELVAQLSTTLFVATDTTTSALVRVFECMASRPDVQAKLRAEIMEAKLAHNGEDLSHDELMALPYLDAVCRETLRIYPPAPLRFREARADAVLPLSQPVLGTDGARTHALPIPKGSLIFVPVQAANTSPALWGTDAAVWRPERWLEQLPDVLLQAKIPGVYSNLMTFWAGGRACIGFKFSQLEMKVVLAELLSAFKFEAIDKRVVWNLGEVVYPTVGLDSSKPEFPMKVAAL